jgi:DNA-binding CsgD family transcriptional regulator
MSKQDFPTRLSQLTERQYEVLELFCAGLDDRAIADKLCLAETTVRKHMHDIRRQLGAADNVEIMRKYCPLLRGEEPPPATTDEAGQPEHEPELGMPRNEKLFLQEPEPPRPNRYLLLLMGVILGACLVVASTACLLYAFREALGMGTAPQVTQVLVGEDRKVTVEVTSVLAPTQPTITSGADVSPTVADTATPQNTETPVPPSPTPEPTYTPVPPTPTPIPTDTPIPTPTVPPDTPPGSVLEVGDSWRQNGVRLKLIETNLSSECVSFSFDFYNETNHQMVVEIDPEAFSVRDNLGQQWELVSISDWTICDTRGIYVEKQSETVDPGDNYGAHWFGFKGPVTDSRVNEVVITVEKISQISNARWRVPIYN